MSRMITVVKLNPRGVATVRYQGEILKSLPHGVVLEAAWTWPTRDLGYTVFETGDIFTEYYYTDRWYNIFDIHSSSGERKGWYCNIASPAHIFADRIEQIDLLLDVWINPQGEPLLLDEDEFVADTTLSDEQRNGARQGLQSLLHMLATRQEVFSTVATP